MKSSLSAVLAFSLAGYVTAYPNILEQVRAQGNSAPSKRQDSVAFDAAAQYIDTTGDYAFNPPGSSDQRGPCPGLNALANHGYLPHDGVATIAEFVQSTNKVFGMGLDLGTFLSVYGAVQDGDGLQWSIGGPTASVGSILGLTGTPQGISGSHNKYESDVSPTRGDLYEYGNDYLVIPAQFQALYDKGKAADNYDLALLNAYRAERFQQSIENNPYFFNAPFAGVVVQPAAYSFIFRFMGNKSAEYPEGQLNGEVLKSFFAITGEDGDFTYTPGHERIPDNWYTRNILDPYSIPFFSVDLNLALLEYPQFASIGGNTGEVNTFTGVDVDTLTDSVFNAQTLLEGNNAACFGFQAAVQFLPDLASSLIAPLTSALATVTSDLSCPQLETVDESQFAQFPGYEDLSSSGTY